MNKNEIGLAGEFFVLAQLARQGYIGTLTLGHTKGVDILVSDEQFNSVFRVEVKTTQVKPHHSQLSGTGRFYSWPMSEKHEKLNDPNLIYCFVHLSALDELPKFFYCPGEGCC